LPIALACRIHQGAQYRHIQTVYHHYLFTNTPLFLAALHWTQHYHAHTTPMDLFLHTSTSSALLPLFTKMHYFGLSIIAPYGCQYTCYQDTETAPLQCHALECHTNPLFPYPRTPTASFWLYWTTAVSAELNTDNPDPTPTPCLAGHYCTAFSYQATPLQHQPFSCIPSMLPRRTGLSLFLEAVSRGLGGSSL
jgi:hypothetical protein